MIRMIAAAAKNGVIGANGKIPWHIPEDMAYFRQLTTGNVVIMGRRTFESIGFLLPDRYHIIVSRMLKRNEQMLCTAESLEKAIEIAENYTALHEGTDIFLCGGQQIYTQGLRYAERIYLTELDDAFEGDTFFPDFRSAGFVLKESRRSETKNLSYSLYVRNENRPPRKPEKSPEGGPSGVHSSN